MKEGKDGARHLLKNARLIRSRPQVKYGFIARYRRLGSTRTMCRLLGVSTNGFYDWFDRPMSQHACENDQLLQAIMHSRAACDGTYVFQSVVRDLMDAGLACSENRGPVDAGRWYQGIVQVLSYAGAA